MDSPATLPTLAIVIPAYNEEKTIRACVLAALGQTIPADDIIVVDNKSTDATDVKVNKYGRGKRGRLLSRGQGETIWFILATA